MRLLLALMWSANLAFLAAAVLRVWLGLPYAVVTGAGLAVMACVALRYWRTADVGPMQLSMSAVQPLSSSQARTLRADARRALDRAGEHAGRRAVAQLNLARALLWLSMPGDARNELAESRALIEKVLQDPRTDRRYVLDAAADLVSAVDSYARRTRDGSDYPVVLRILGDLAEGVPEAQAKLFECRADYELFLGDSALEEAQTSGDVWPVVPHYIDAAHYLTTASELACSDEFRLVAKARAAAADAQVTSLNPLGRLDRLESDEEDCREAFAHFRPPGPGWMITGMMLAGCLSATARFQLDKGPGGKACQRLSEAEDLCNRMLRHAADYEPIVRQLHTQILRTKEEHCG